MLLIIDIPVGQLSGIIFDFPDPLELAHPIPERHFGWKAALKCAKCGCEVALVPKYFQWFYVIIT